MINQIRTSELFEDDYINKLISQLEKLKNGYADTIETIKKEAGELGEANKRLAVNTAKAFAENGKQAEQAEQLNAAFKKYQDSLNETSQQIAIVRQAQQQLNAVQKLAAKEAQAAAGSYDQLSAQLSILKIRWKQLSEAERENTVEGRALSKSIGEIDNKLKGLDESVGVHTRKVGNYRDAIADLPGAFGAAGRGATGLGNAFKALLANPVVLVVGLISAALTTLFSAFTRSEKGAQLMAKASAALEGVMSVLSSVVTVVVDKIVEFANDPVKSVKALGTAIVENITNRIEGALNMVVGLGKSLAALASGDLQAAKKAFTDAGTAATQFMTGLDEKQQKAVFDGLEKITNEATKAAAAFVALETARRNVANANRQLTRTAEQLATTEAVNNAIAQDTTRTLEEREQAAIKATKAAQDRAAKEVAIAQNNLSIIERELALRQSNGENVQSLLDQQIAAYQALAGAQREFLLADIEGERQRMELKRDAFERELDFAIDVYDAQKMANERRLQDERLTFEQRRALLAETVALDKSAFEEQARLVNDYTGKKIDFNELVLISDEKLVRAKVAAAGVDDIVAGRILEIIRERKAAFQDLADAERELIADETKAAIEREKLAKATAEALRKAEIDKLDQLQDLAKSEFALLKKSEKEKEIFELEQAAKRNRALIELQKKNGGELTDVQLQTLENQAKAIDAKVAELKGKKKSFSLWDLILPNDPERDGKIGVLQNVLNQAKGYVSEFINAVQAAANARVTASEKAVQTAENEFNRQIELEKLGLANRLDIAKTEFEQAKERNKQAVEQQRKTQKQLAAIDTAQQAVSIATAIANVWKTFSGLGPAGIALGTAASALLLGSFLASKIKAATLAKQEYHDGGFDFIGGGTHASGNDTDLGYTTKNGKRAFAERGEFVGVVNARQTSKYRPILPAIINSLNQGTFETAFALPQGNMAIYQGQGISTKAESNLERIAKSTEKMAGSSKEEIHIVGDVMIRKNGNWTTRIKGKA